MSLVINSAKIFANIRQADNFPVCRELNNNDLAFVGDEAFEHLHDLEIIKLEGNGWNCDCKILYVAKYVCIACRTMKIRLTCKNILLHSDI